MRQGFLPGSEFASLFRNTFNPKVGTQSQFARQELEAGAVTRLQLTSEIAESQLVSEDIDIRYSPTQVNDSSLVLPSLVHEIVHDPSGHWTKVDIEFHQYRRFVVDSVIVPQ